jgi:hypothetical protein
LAARSNCGASMTNMAGNSRQSITAGSGGGSQGVAQKAIRPRSHSATSSIRRRPRISSVPAQLGNAVSTMPAMMAAAKPKMNSWP